MAQFGHIDDIDSMAKITGFTAIVLADSTGEILSAAIDSNLCRGVRLIYNYDTAGASGTLVIKLTEADTSGGSYSDVTGATTGSLTSAGGSTAIWDRLNTKRYFKISMTAGVNAIDANACLELYNSKTSPNPL